ncbi:hypothetical protein EJ08DRAFT_683774 [Tothia fuscella]|uniref:Uncharacterized protein n=1 Tax=Tothia fuscella TaxID=1048955 RepID=A0A9P4NF24_9PEZI|nr:hypothetical protein EJ08DRAFT_683774 [Tothia fuscella]
MQNSLRLLAKSIRKRTRRQQSGKSKRLNGLLILNDLINLVEDKTKLSEALARQLDTARTEASKAVETLNTKVQELESQNGQIKQSTTDSLGQKSLEIGRLTRDVGWLQGEKRDAETAVQQKKETIDDLQRRFREMELDYETFRAGILSEGKKIAAQDKELDFVNERVNQLEEQLRESIKGHQGNNGQLTTHAADSQAVPFKTELERIRLQTAAVLGTFRKDMSDDSRKILRERFDELEEELRSTRIHKTLPPTRKRMLCILRAKKIVPQSVKAYHAANSKLNLEICRLSYDVKVLQTTEQRLQKQLNDLSKAYNAVQSKYEISVSNKEYWLDKWQDQSAEKEEADRAKASYWQSIVTLLEDLRESSFDYAVLNRDRTDYWVKIERAHQTAKAQLSAAVIMGDSAKYSLALFRTRVQEGEVHLNNTVEIYQAITHGYKKAVFNNKLTIEALRGQVEILSRE